MQEALARAWERSERGEEIRSLEAWVTRVALNLSKSGLRRVRAERRARERLRPPTAGEPSSIRVDVERSLSTLPLRQRQVTVLHYFLGLGVQDIAEILGVHDGTVKTNLYRARLALADALGESVDEEANHGER